MFILLYFSVGQLYEVLDLLRSTLIFAREKIDGFGFGGAISETI